MLGRRRFTAAAGLALAAPVAAYAQQQQPQQRIVSIGGALTETVCLLGLQSRLVGVDTTSLHPASVRQLPSVGYARTLSAEGLLSLAPTLVVASEDAGPPAVLRQLEAARVPLHVLGSDHRFEGLLERTQRLAALVQREAAGRELVAQLQADWRASRERVAALRARPGAAAPKAMFLLAHAGNQMRIAGRGTAADAMLAYAGADNVFGTAFDGYKPLTPEAAIAAAPQLIVTTEQGIAAVGGVAGVLRTPGLAQTPAGRAQRVVVLDALLLLGFGPRLPQAVSTLAEAVHAPAPRPA